MRRKPKIKKAALVEYEGKRYRVIRRRRVTGMAMFQTSEYEVKLETLDGSPFGYVAENEVTKIEKVNGK